jgi:trehalose-6-phosphate synthase
VGQVVEEGDVVVVHDVKALGFPKILKSLLDKNV